MELFVQQLVNGLVVGSIYALITTGLIVIFSMMHIVNFAHGQFFMLGAFVSYTVMNVLGGNFLTALIASFVIVILLAIGIERVVIRPCQVRKIPMLVAGIATVGLAFVLEEVAALIWGKEEQMITSPFAAQSINILGIHLSALRLFVPTVAAILIVLLLFFVYKTKTGAALRAVSQDGEAASLMGINIGNAYTIGFSLSCGIAAISGALLSQMMVIEPNMGLMYSLKAFVIIVVGGMMSLPGAVAASYILGMGGAFVSGYIGAAFENLFFFGMMVLILLVKPEGLFGGRGR